MSTVEHQWQLRNELHKGEPHLSDFSGRRFETSSEFPLDFEAADVPSLLRGW